MIYILSHDGTERKCPTVGRKGRKSMGKVIAVANQKGGVGKTTTAAALGDMLNHAGFKVLLIDMDGQANLTYNMGIERPDKLTHTVTDLIMAKANGEAAEYNAVEFVLKPGISLFPANIVLSGLEMSLINAFQREQILRLIINDIRDQYDYIIVDTSPSLGLLTINSLVAVDEVVIPVQAQVFAVKGMEQLFKSISLAKRINPDLQIAGILLTMVDGRSGSQKDTVLQLDAAFGNTIPKFETVIPLQVNGSRASKEQEAITSFDPDGAAAKAYQNWLTEYMGITQYVNLEGSQIEIGDVLQIGTDRYLIHYGYYDRRTRDGKIVKTLGAYAEMLTDEMSHDGTEGIFLSIGSFMQRYKSYNRRKVVNGDG